MKPAATTLQRASEPSDEDKLGNESVLFDCSACGALVGEPCTTRGREASLHIGTLGQFAVYPHPERQRHAISARDHKVEQLIPVVRHTQADIYAAEAEVRRAYRELHGHEPGDTFTRECAWRLLDRKAAGK